MRTWGGRHGQHRRPLFMVHGYITAGCHTRGALLGLSLFIILAHLTCVFYLVFRLGLFLILFHITTDTSLSISSTNRVHDHDNDHQPAETHQRTQQRSSPKRRRKGAVSHGYIISHLTHKMFGRSRKASVSQSTTKSKPPSTAVTRDSGVSKRRPSTASISRRRPSNACSAQNLVDPSGKWVSPLRLNCIWLHGC